MKITWMNRKSYWRSFIGNDADSIIPKWESIQSGSKFHFSAGAFFFGVIWLFYRKLYKYAFIVIGIIIGESLILEIILAPNLTTSQYTLIDGIFPFCLILYIRNNRTLFVLQR